MTWFWAKGKPITVITDADDKPRQFVWQAQTHRVETIDRDWRVDFGWWRRRQWRSYYLLRTDTGILVEIYHDLSSRQWYLQRLYD